MANNCQRGPSNCQFSHQTKLFPCKWIHATGMCDKGENCRFSHNILNELEIQKFMKENEEFLEEKFKSSGATNLGIYYIRFREESMKAKAVAILNPTTVMIPPSLQDTATNVVENTDALM